MSFQKTIIAALLATSTLLAGCQATDMKMGSAGAKTVATGSAAGGSSDNANADLQRCQSPLGTISLVENEQAGWYTILRNEYKLPPTSNLLRLIIQQSNCFVIVERSRAGMNAMNRERELMNAGEARAGSNLGKGQVVASDYALSPEIIVSANDTGGMGGAVGGLFGGRGSLLGAVVGAGLSTKEASVMLTLVDNRSGVQVAISEGSASKSDFSALAGLFGGSGGASFGAYSKTPQGKVLVAAFMDSYNNMVISLRNYKAQVVQGQGLGGGGRLTVDGSAPPSQTRAGQQQPEQQNESQAQPVNTKKKKK